MKHRVVVEIDLAALVRNYRKIAARVQPLQVLCVLKANAYGLGVKPCAEALMAAGCRHFGVAEPYEALELLAAVRRTGCDGVSVQMLSSVLPDEIPEMVANGVVLPVVSLESAQLIAAAADAAGTRARVHCKIDTGMGRLGIVEREALPAIRQIFAMPQLDCEGVFTHCPMAYDPGHPFTPHQIERFAALVRRAAEAGFVFRYVHIAASDAINNFPRAAEPPFNMVRTGINLHGSFDPNGIRSLDVEPVLTLRTRVAQVRELTAGSTLGYGRTWCLSEATRVATISAGYADGLPLALSNRGYVFIGGRRCPVIGRISMDYATVDVSDVPGVRPGDDVVCLGSCGEDRITPDDWARLKGTHAYDIICSLGSRVERRFVAAQPALDLV